MYSEVSSIVVCGAYFQVNADQTVVLGPNPVLPWCHAVQLYPVQSEQQPEVSSVPLPHVEPQWP